MSQQKILIALPLDEDLLTPLHAWGQKYDWSQVSEIHFSHIVKKTMTPLEFGLVEMPDENTFRNMKPTLQKFLDDEAKKILAENFKGKIFTHLKADFDPEEEVTRYLLEGQMDLVVVSTKGKHGFSGLFHSSFTEHMIRFAPCNVLVIRPQTR
jgi:nucleotide-binding universal stress UspA family protein